MLVPSTSIFLPFTGENTVLHYALTYVKPYLINSLRTGIRTGSLRLTDGGEEFNFGTPQSEKKHAEIHVKNSNFWLRIFFSHDLGFSEAYMHGDFATPNLKAILDLWLDNRDSLVQLSSYVAKAFTLGSAITLRLFGQSLSNAKLCVMASYDCSNEFFQALLSDDMMYSCAIWPESLGGVRGDLISGPTPGDLEAAQLNKVHHVLRKARVRAGDRLLEFGSGWGTMAIEAAKLGCTVDTLTLSEQQKIMAERRVAALGLSDRVTVHLMDYRNLPPEFEKKFDAFVAVEMVEHIGLKFHEKFFQIIDWALKDERAAICISATTQPEWRYSTFQATDYARKYQWPNSFLPCPSVFVGTAHKAVPGRLSLESVEDYSHHYPRTLREWGRRLQKNWTPKTIAALVARQPELAHGDQLAVFKRKFEYMCVYAEVGFARAYTGVHFFTFARPENAIQPCD